MTRLIGLILLLGAWWALFVALALLTHDPDSNTLRPCSYYEAGTDAFLECTTGEAIDLSPVQDEAQTLKSIGRVEL